VPENLQAIDASEGLWKDSASALPGSAPDDAQAEEAQRATALALMESEERFHLLVDAVTDYAIYMLDPEGRVMTWNRGAERNKGYKAEEMLGRNFSIFFQPEDVEAGLPQRELAAAARDGHFAVDGWRRRKNGERFWAQITLTAIRGEQGELRGFAKVTRDMSRQKTAEESLRKRNAELERYRMMIENIDEYAIYTIDLEGKITSWEAGAQKVTHTTPEQMLGKHYSMFFSPEEVLAGLPERDLREAARTGRHVVDAWRFTPSGERVWSSGVINALRDETGKLTGYLRMARIQTPQKEVEDGLRALNAQLDRYRVIVENITDHVIFTLDAEGRIDSWSPGAQKVLGYTAEEALGREYSLIFTPEDIDAGAPRSELEETARNGHCGTESWRVRKGGERFWSTGETTATRDGLGQVNGYVRVARDTTRQKRQEESLGQLAAELEDRVSQRTRQLEDTVVELLQKNAEVERMARSTARDLEEKKVMLNEIHHRVKNNLQVVQSLLKMSVRTLPAGEARSVTMTTAQRVHAMAMVHERLYQTRDLGGISVSTYLRDVFAGVTDLYPSLRGQIKLELDADEILLGLDQGIPFGLMVNELLSNSLKHGFPEGRRGTVSVSIHRVQGAVCVAVQDDGVGLPEGFEASKSTSMGLKLAESLARQLGGNLTFTSSRGCRVEAKLKRFEDPPAGQNSLESTNQRRG
jgi:PAS domain S-box-containing protein